MDTINIAGRTINVSEKLSAALWELYAYAELPLAVKIRIDPKCNRSQELYDDVRSELYAAFDDEDFEEEFDQNMLDWIDLALDQHCV